MRKPNFLTYRQIGDIAREFLQKHHPSLDIPVPIETIIEFKLGLNIFPFPNLYQSFGINGFLTSDLKEIYVDELQFGIFNEKYRFTLAHEIGHLILHRSWYDDIPWKTFEDYIKWNKSVDDQLMGMFEIQGNFFAEQVLVPEEQLIEACKRVARDHRGLFKQMSEIPDSAWSYMANEIGRFFEVSPSVINCRINRAGIDKIIDLKSV